jgi:hypothetical protein
VIVLAIWFGVAVFVGLLLGYAARRLKGAPKRRLSIRKAGDTDAEHNGDQHKRVSPREYSIRANKRYPRLWCI